MDLNEDWASLKLELIMKTEACESTGFDPTMTCPIPDVAMNLDNLIREKIHEIETDTTAKKEMIKKAEESILD